MASVSHELRTPLTSIIGYLELALDDPPSPPAPATRLTVAERNASRLLELVADILVCRPPRAKEWGWSSNSDPPMSRRWYGRRSESIAPRAVDTACTSTPRASSRRER